jgi:uncharacterized repeat protein (TIGR01451 family)
MFLGVLVTLAMVISLFGMAIPASAAEITATKNITDPFAVNIYYLDDTIYYHMTVENPGGNSQNNTIIEVRDKLPSGTVYYFIEDGTDPPLFQEPGDVEDYYISYNVSKDDLVWIVPINPAIDPYWGVINRFIAIGYDSLSDDLTANVTKNSRIIRPSINITKTVDFDDDGVYTDLETNRAGQNASWNVTVCNNGYDPIYDIEVTDTNGHNFGAVFNLTAGECKTFIYDEVINAGKVNTAYAQGYDDLDNPVGPVDDDAEVVVVDARISIAPNATNPVGMAHDFTVTVEIDDGDGWDPVVGVNVTPSLAGGSVGSIISSPPYTTDGSGEVTVSVNSSVAGVAYVHASASVPVDGGFIDVATDGYGAFVVDNEKTWVKAKIGISPPDETNWVEDDHVLTACVWVDDGSGYDWYDQPITINFYNVGVGSLNVTSVLTSTGCAQVTLTTTEPGHSTVTAQCAFSVDGVAFNISTNGSGENGLPAQKTWVDARISIEESDTNPVNTAHNFTVTVEMNDGDGWDPAVGVNVTPSHSGVGSITSTGPYMTDGSGQVIVTVNSAIAGSATVHASATVNVGGIDIDVATDGYGAYYVSNVKTWEEEGDQGCTPGFWKNNAENKDASAWVGYAPGDSFECVFGVDVTLRGKGKDTYPAPTLLQALNANGGGINALARHAVAALLNIANPDIAYGIGSTGALITMVHDAIVSGEDAIDALHILLADYNEAGCPIDQHWTMPD